MSTPAWMIAAQTYKGVTEVRGHKHNNKIILEYFDAVGHGYIKNDEVPWCAAFVGACLEEANYKGTGALNARSYLKWGKKVTKPRYGDVVVFWRGKKNGWQGHVAFFVKETKSYVYVLGGNLLGIPLDYVQYLAVALTIAGLGLVLYARWDDLKNKGR